MTNANVVEKVKQQIINDPRSGQALLLFALVSTLNVERTGHMYMLGKLKEFTAENRQLAYGLMEMMADNQIHDQVWQEAFSAMETAMRQQ